MTQDFRYFHLFNRGVDKRLIFQDANDYGFMYMLFARYLGPIPLPNKWDGGFYPNYHGKVRLLSFCLMPNHFHMEIEELTLGATAKFMHDLKTAYTKYFNNRNTRSGALFESRYRFKEIFTSESLINVCRYIHLNPLAFTSNYEHYIHSSMRYYLGELAPSWLSTKLILSCFSSSFEFEYFHENEVRHRAMEYLEQPVS